MDSAVSADHIKPRHDVPWMATPKHHMMLGTYLTCLPTVTMMLVLTSLPIPACGV
jgi:hypothetical protein